MSVEYKNDFIKYSYIHLVELIVTDGWDFDAEMFPTGSIYVKPFFINKYGKKRYMPFDIRISDHPSQRLKDFQCIEPNNPSVKRAWKYAKRKYEKSRERWVDKNYREHRKAAGKYFSEARYA